MTSTLWAQIFRIIDAACEAVHGKPVKMWHLEAGTWRPGNDFEKITLNYGAHCMDEGSYNYPMTFAQLDAVKGFIDKLKRDGLFFERIVNMIVKRRKRE